MSDRNRDTHKKSYNGTGFNNPFQGRTIQLVQDLSIDEQRYLYQKTLEYKKAVLTKNDAVINSYKINDDNFSVYLLFQENSTRTKESFYNAARFHNARTKDLSIDTSSLLKNETFTDTVKTLMGYADHSCFIIRSEIEGLCRWLETTLGHYASQSGIEMPFCINAGDGRNEHPTQEFLDEFTFNEYYQGDFSHIHIALIGDLLHGRTVHSKCGGLKIFNEVEVDLIAPSEIAMPSQYIDEMKALGFQVRIFDSIDSYTAQSHMADIWYFTRLQRERMSDDLLPRLERIRSKISLHDEHLEKIKEEVKFFHPLPRDKLHPTIPFFLDNTPYNGWDQQSVNGYFVRITLLAMLKGVIGADFSGEPLMKQKHTSDFITTKNISQDAKKIEKPKQKIGIKPVENGIVIDHIASGKDISQIWDRINIIRKIMKLHVISSHGVYKSYAHNVHKGIISLPDFEILELTEFKKLGAMSPGCTINVIQDSQVVKKMKIEQPPRIYNFKEITCRNPRCISFSNNHEQAYADFHRKDNDYFCNYCKMQHTVNEIWNVHSLR